MIKIVSIGIFFSSKGFFNNQFIYKCWKWIIVLCYFKDETIEESAIKSLKHRDETKNLSVKKTRHLSFYSQYKYKECNSEL